MESQNIFYESSKHEVVLKLLAAAGFKGIEDQKKYDAQAFAPNFITHVCAYLNDGDNLMKTCLMFGKSKPDMRKWTIKEALQWVNPIIQGMYGCKIFSVRAGKQKAITHYMLVNNYLNNIFFVRKDGEDPAEKVKIFL